MRNITMCVGLKSIYKSHVYKPRMPPKIAVSDDEESAELSDIGERSDDVSDVQNSDDMELGDGEDDDTGTNEYEELQNDWYTPKVHANERRTRGSASSNNKRETRKRQLAMYDEDDLDEDQEEEEEALDEYVEEPPKKKISVKLRIPKRSATSSRASRSESPLDEDFSYTPTTQKLTERQRARLAEGENGRRTDDTMFQEMDEQLLALNRKTQKKAETAEEAANRKAENARRRADYKVKQLEEEKRDTLNKLLKRRAIKTREKDDDETDSKQTSLKPRRPTLQHPALIRWVCKPESSVLGVSE